MARLDLKRARRGSLRKAALSTELLDLLDPTPAKIGALAIPVSVPDVATLELAAVGTTTRLIICQSDPLYSTTGPTLNIWDGTNLLVFAGTKRN